MRSLSSTVTETPSSWQPSRSVVSKISTWGEEAETASPATSTAPAPLDSADMLAPVLVLVLLAVHGAAVHLRDRLRHRARAEDQAVVDRVDRAHLGRGPADEQLLGDVQVAPGEVVDAAVEAQVAGDRHHRALRDAL